MTTGSETYSNTRWTYILWSIIAYGVTCSLIPIVTLAPTIKIALMMYYVISLFMGFAFGSVYTRFQACTWVLIPPHADIGNAMGFAAVAKCAGAGAGNFLIGLLLDRFRRNYDQVGQSYARVGYVVMSWTSAFCVFVSAAIVISIARKQRRLLFSSRSWFCLC